MGTPSLTYREYAQVCSGYRALGRAPLSAEQLQRQLVQRLQGRYPALADRLSGLSAAEVRTLVLHLWRYHQGSKEAECLRDKEGRSRGTRRQT
jgi:hypothetical protein